jgi:hypothetical protein
MDYLLSRENTSSKQSNLLRARSVSVNRNSTDDLQFHLFINGREISSEHF